jgi:hypothetical protein
MPESIELGNGIDYLSFDWWSRFAPLAVAAFGDAVRGNLPNRQGAKRAKFSG